MIGPIYAYLNCQQAHFCILTMVPWGHSDGADWLYLRGFIRASIKAVDGGQRVWRENAERRTLSKQQLGDAAVES